MDYIIAALLAFNTLLGLAIYGTLNKRRKHRSRAVISFTNPLVTVNPEGTKEIHDMALNVTPNDTIEGGLTVKDADGDVLSGSTVAFSSSDTAVLGVVDNGDGTYKATAVALGDAAIQATVSGDVPISLALDVHVQTGPAVAASFTDPVITTVDAPIA